MWYEINPLPGFFRKSPRAYPEKYDKYVSSLQEHNEEFTIKLWNNTEIAKLWALPELKQYKRFFSYLPKHMEKCDFTRYAIMHLYGGIYLDLNTMCYKNLSPLLANRDFGITYEPPEHGRKVTTSCLMSAAGHPFWTKLMDFINTNYVPAILYNRVLDNTGPIGLATFVESTYDETQMKSMLLLNEHVQPYYSLNNASALSRVCSTDSEKYLAKIWHDGAGWGVNIWGKIAESILGFLAVCIYYVRKPRFSKPPK